MKILIIKLSAIGDTIHVFPSLDLIRINFPESNISWVVCKKASELIYNNNKVDDVFILSNNFPKSIFSDFNIILKLYKIKWDIIIDYHNIFKTFILKLFLRGSIFTYNYKNCPLFENKISYLLSNFNSDYIHDKSKIDNALKLTKFIIRKYKNKINYDYKYEKIINFKYIPSSINWLLQNNMKNYIVICVNTTGKSRLWKYSNWIKLFELLQKNDYLTLLLGLDFSDMGKKIKENVKETKKLKILPNFNLLECCYILNNSTLLIGVDSSILHLGNYLSVKTLGLFGPSCAIYNGANYYDKFNYIQAKTKFIRHKNLKDFECMNQITPDIVINKINKIIN